MQGSGVEAAARHVPVMLEEVLEHLKPRPGQTILDGTAGSGGHAAVIKERLQPGGRLILLDRDAEALKRLIARFGRSSDLRYFHANFCDFHEVLAACGEKRLDGALVDLGVSSEQLADGERGFSFDRPGPLDMRMDRSEGPTAEEIVNRWGPDRLVWALKTYGDQPMARRIVLSIVEARQRRPIRRTDELAEIVRSALPAATRRRQRIHPATRVFQALRIAVNDELGSLETFLDKIFDYLKPGGRVVVISFHSGEDRLVKHRFRQAASCGLIEVPFSRPKTPTPEEVAANPRSRSARMRVAIRLPIAGRA